MFHTYLGIASPDLNIFLAKIYILVFFGHDPDLLFCHAGLIC